MNTYYLKGLEDDLMLALIDAGLYRGALQAVEPQIDEETGEEIPPAFPYDKDAVQFYGEVGGYHLDWIGQIVLSVDEEGVATLTDEHHINIYSAKPLPDSLNACCVDPEPSTPVRKLAGT